MIFALITGIVLFVLLFITIVLSDEYNIHPYTILSLYLGMIVSFGWFGIGFVILIVKALMKFVG